MFAARNNAADIARLLIESGADVNAKDNYEWVALMHALREKAIDVASLLIDAGTYLDKKSYDDMTELLFDAARNDTAEIARLLIEAGVDVNSKKTALPYSCWRRGTTRQTLRNCS